LTIPAFAKGKVVSAAVAITKDLRLNMVLKFSSREVGLKRRRERKKEEARSVAVRLHKGEHKGAYPQIYRGK
jgi:hypothetical protein